MKKAFGGFPNVAIPNMFCTTLRGFEAMVGRAIYVAQAVVGKPVARLRKDQAKERLEEDKIISSNNNNNDKKCQQDLLTGGSASN